MTKYKLIIAEKPSVAKSIAAVLSPEFQQKKGYLKGNEYLISWCFGHLAALSDASFYNPDYAKWNLKDLPILPRSFHYHVQSDKRNQFEVISSLMHDSNVTEVINACDAGREGELIFRTVYNLAGCSKPMKRLWISSMEDDAIRDGFANLRFGNDFDGLYKSALCRNQADWLVGINATRYFSLIYGHTLNIGRVMSPTLSLLVQRNSEIASFIPEPFYKVELDCGFRLSSDRLTDKQAAQALSTACKNASITILSTDRKEHTEKAPALYDLTTLQRDANRILGFTAQQTLDYLQSLYEKKLCSYPRTDSRYLTDDMEKSVPEYAAISAIILGTNVPDTIHTQQICNSKKVTDHHAIIPTQSAGKIDIGTLPVGEQEIMKLIATSFLRGICLEYKYAITLITADCLGNTFQAKCKEISEPGWTIYSAKEDKDCDTLPSVAEGQVFPVSKVALKEGKTTAPKYHTEDTLLAAMENAGSKDMPEDVERKGIGTPATRAGILEKLVSSGFIQRKKSKKAVYLHPTEIGIALITVLPEQLQSPLLTAEWEYRLKKVESGSLSESEFLQGIAEMIIDLIQGYTPYPGAEVLFPPEHNSIGKCPRCGASVTEHNKGYFCERKACNFALWKNNRFFEAKKKTLDASTATALLKHGQVLLKNCYSAKTGKYYDATVIMEDTGNNIEFKLVFNKT